MGRGSALFFKREKAAKADVCVIVDGDHGRIEIRRCRVRHDFTWLSTSLCFPHERRFRALATLAVIEAQVERDVTTTI